MKERNIIFHPTFKMLSAILLIYGIIVSTLVAISIRVGGDMKNVLGIAALTSGFVFITYIIIGFLTMIHDFFNDRSENGIIYTIKRGGKMLSFIGTIISSFINFGFSVSFLALSFAKNSIFYLFVSIFYLLALILKTYLLSTIYENERKTHIKNYIITSIGTIIMALLMVGIVTMVSFFGDTFSKSVALLALSISFAMFKIISAYFSYRWYKRRDSFLKLSLSLISLIFAIFTIFTIHVQILTSFFKDATTISLSFTGYPFALGMLVIGIISLIHGIKEYKASNVEEIDISESF